MIRTIAAIAILKLHLARNRVSGMQIAAWCVLALGAVVLAALAAGAAWLGHRLGMAAPPWSRGARALAFDGGAAAGALLALMALSVDVQRNDPLDLRRFAQFPVRLGALFAINFLASLFNPAPLLAAAACAGLGLGLHRAGLIAPGPALGVLGGYAAALAAWMFFLRGWFGLALQDRRRRRLLLTAAPLLAMLLSQLPYLAINAIDVRDLERGQGLLEAARAWAAGWGATPERLAAAAALGHAAFPPLWSSVALDAALEGDRGRAAAAGAAQWALTAAVLFAAWRGTRRHALGAAGLDAASAGRVRAMPLTARGLAGLGGDTAALAWATLLGLLRHPQVRMLLVSPVMMGALLVVMWRTGLRREVYGADPVLPGVLLYFPFLSFSMLAFNQFGLDPAGFCALTLMPTPRHRVLLAKNLALLPFVAGMGAAMVTLCTWLLELPLRLAAIGLANTLFLYLALCAAGNFVSVYLPYALASSPMARQAARGERILGGLLGTVLAMAFVAPAMLCMAADRWSGAAGLASPGAIGAGVLVAAGAAAYAASLRHAGDLLLLREKAIAAALLRDRP